jgi:hypothetical protein
MCREMSQYMPNTAVSSDTDARPDGRATQPGRPETRSDRSAAQPSNFTRPLRWPMPSTNRPIVKTIAAALTPTTSVVAAPPAGFAAAAMASKEESMA